METETQKKVYTKPKLTRKQRGFVKDYIKTGNGVQSALKHYEVANEHVARSIASENLTKPVIAAAIQDALSDDLLSKVHLEGLEATRIIPIGEGQTEEISDHPTRAKFLDLAYKVKGSYAPEKTIGVHINADAPQNTEAKGLAELYEEKLRATLLKPKHEKEPGTE